MLAKKAYIYKLAAAVVQIKLVWIQFGASALDFWGEQFLIGRNTQLFDFLSSLSTW